MSAETGTKWQQLCRELEVSPDEVSLVFSRYDAYRQFTAKGPGEPISLEQWFQFYHMEKASEFCEEKGPSPGGCSVDCDAVNNACIKRPADFLKILQAYCLADASV
jgi:hypothetical protein